MIEPEVLMQAAIEKAREGIAAGQSPFGCAICRQGELLAVAHNTVIASPDITAHAEVNALRQACQKTEFHFLEKSVVATTCEPCPMCMAALHWARVETVYYGATIADATAAGFNEIQLPAERIVQIGGSQVKLVSGLLQKPCRELFQLWQETVDPQTY